MAAIARSKVLHLLNKEMYDGTGIPMTSDGHSWAQLMNNVASANR